MNTLKRVLLRMGTASLAGFVLLTSGCSQGRANNGPTSIEQTYEQTKKKFAPGEHVISLPLDKNPINYIVQYPHYDGYKAIGLATYHIYGCILYINDEEVECTATSTDKNGNVVYCEFGTPTVPKEVFDENITEETKDFDIGEHILSIPIDKDLTKTRIQYPYYDGYEVMDVSVISTTYRGYYFDGACILYVNTVPVRCKLTNHDENNNPIYCEFGTPLELENGKVLKKVN